MMTESLLDQVYKYRTDDERMVLLLYVSLPFSNPLLIQFPDHQNGQIGVLVTFCLVYLRFGGP
jgi:hypothetical protein